MRRFGKDRCGYDARNTGLRHNRSLPRCRDGNRRGGAERGRGRTSSAARVSVASPRAPSRTRRAGDVAPYHVRGHGAERGRGGRPRPPACPSRPRGRLRVHGAPGTSRPTMCDTGGPRLSRPSRRCPSLERGCFACADLAKTDVATTPGIPGYATIGLCQGAGTGTGEESGGRGRGGRPRPPACPWRPRGRLRVRGAPGTSRPTMCADMARSVVGADVLGRPRVRGVPAGAFAYAARRGRRALPCARTWRGAW